MSDPNTEQNDRPFSAIASFKNGSITNAPSTVRYLSEIAPLFINSTLAAERASARDEVIYRVARLPGSERFSIPEASLTCIEAGDIDREFFMTHGHDHFNSIGESYMCLTGTGGLLMRRGDETLWIEMRPGVLVQLPNGWRHRSVNTGADQFVFAGYYSVPSPIDYHSAVALGLGARVFKQDSGYRVVRADGTIIFSSL